MDYPDEIEDFEMAVNANGYRSMDKFTQAEYERTRKNLSRILKEHRKYEVALLEIASDGDGTGKNPQLMVDIAVRALNT